MLCAVAARAAALGLTEPPGDAQRDLAEREGWIHLPADGVTLRALVSGHGGE